MIYRREIDGLRALAVIPVILFHAGVKSFSGGFAGVDVFFVISGYLITSIILKEKEQGTFSLIRFYERRARRILPALFLVLAVSVPFAWFWLVPRDAKDFAQSLVGVSVYASNILFWRESGYFETAAELKPLLHTWSLAVEEQFYVVFPLLLAALWRFGKRATLLGLGVVAAISFGLALVGARGASIAAFFLLHARAWELLIGGFIAFLLKDAPCVSHEDFKSNLLSAVGVALILVALFSFDKTTPWPSAYTLLPVLGAGLVILFASPQTLVGRLLGSRAFVGIGLISYSAYLWHQPMFAFARHRIIPEPSGYVYALLCVATLVLAYLTWRFVETPFRKPNTISRKVVFLSVAAASVLFISIGVVGHLKEGYPDRGAALSQLAELDRRVRVNTGLGEVCDRFFTGTEGCATGQAPEVVVWGDSYAMHLIQALSASKSGLEFVQLTASTCGPVAGVAPRAMKYPATWGEGCIQHNDRVLDWVKQNTSVKYVVVSSQFMQYVGEKQRLALRSGDVVRARDEGQRYFEETLSTLKGLGVEPVIIGPTPFSGNDVGRCLVKARLFGEDEARCNFSLQRSEDRQPEVLNMLRKLERKYKVIWLEEAICPHGECKAAVDGVMIYRDVGHLSHEGSEWVGKKLNLYDRITQK